jgi:sugar phosphate isomerase/epimerase
MKPCISQACTLPSPFADDIQAYAAGGCLAVEAWLTKLETHLETASVEDTKALLQDRQVRLVAGAYQGGLLLSQGEQRKVHFDHFKRRLDLCQTFAIPTMILTADFSGRVEPTDLERAVVSLTEAARWAQAFRVRLALEFRGRDTFCASLDTAAAVVRACGEPNVGICFDAFHYYIGPSKFEDLAHLTRENCFHVQVCDLAGVARELATDRDRILPGEGDFQLAPVVTHLRRIGYNGYVSLEVLNQELWQVKPAHLVELGYNSLTRLLGEKA